MRDKYTMMRSPVGRTPHFFSKQRPKPNLLSNPGKGRSVKAVKLDENFCTLEKTEEFLGHYSNYYFDMDYKNQLEIQSPDKFKENYMRALQLIDESYEKMFSNDCESIEASTKKVEEFIRYCQIMLTQLEWYYCLLKQVENKASLEQQEKLSDKISRVVLTMCKAIGEHTLLSSFDAPNQTALWKKIFFILETLTCSRILSNIEKIDQYLFKNSSFLSCWFKSYELSGLPFNLTHAQQIMGEYLQAILKELSYINKESLEKYSFIVHKILSAIHLDFTLIYFQGNEITLSINQLERSVQHLKLLVENLFQHREMTQEILIHHKSHVIKSALLLKPGKPQIDGLKKRICLTKTCLNSS